MNDIIGIIDKIIEEHKLILAQAILFEKVTNDASAMMAITKSKEVFMPGRPDQIQGLKKFEDLRNKVEEGLNAHFNREETSLLEAVVEFGDQKFIAPLEKLLAEHTKFRIRIKDIRVEVDELINGQLSRARWEPKAHELRAQVTEMHKNLEQHAKNEQQLLNNLRKELIEAQTDQN